MPMVINYVNKKKVKFIRPPLTAISVWGSQADRVFGALHRARPPLCPLALVMPSLCCHHCAALGPRLVGLSPLCSSFLPPLAFLRSCSMNVAVHPSGVRPILHLIFLNNLLSVV